MTSPGRESRVENLRRLPAHRYRMNALLLRTRGRLGDYRRTCDRLWATARTIESTVVLRRDGRETRIARTVAVQAGPQRGPFFMELSLATGLSTVGMRFDAQRLTLDAAVESAPTYWGASAGVEIEPEELSDAELERVFVSALAELAPPSSLVSPWCPAAKLVRTRLPDRLSRLEHQHRALRPWRMASAGRILARRSFLALVTRTAIRSWLAHERAEGSSGAARRPRSGERCSVVLVGADAPDVARPLMGGSFLCVRRVADSSFVYTPAAELSRSRDDRDFVATGDFDPGVLTEPVDALVLLPGAPAVTREAAADIHARVVLELGSGAVLPEADGTLEGRRIEVLPDLLFSAAAAIACRSLGERRRRSTTTPATRVAFELARLIREVLRDAAERGRSVREQLYLRALGNLQR